MSTEWRWQEPPAILKAFSKRLRTGDLKKLRILSSLSLANAQDTIFTPDLVDHVERCAQFVGGGDRKLLSMDWGAG